MGFWLSAQGGERHLAGPAHTRYPLIAQVELPLGDAVFISVLHFFL